MKKVFFYIFIFFFACQFIACSFLDSEDLDKTWIYGDEMSGPDFDSSKLTAVSFLSLYADGTYTRDFGSFDYGRWKSDNRRIILISHENRIKMYGMNYKWPNNLKLVAADGFVAGFEAQPTSFSTAAEDPFSMPNNRWRMPAMQKETEKQLKARLANHCRFWEKYFAWALNDKIDYVDVRSTPTLLKIYGNGMVLKIFKDLPSGWKSYFFDEEDCARASDIMQNIFEQHKIKIMQTKNKYEMFRSMFQQLQQLLQ